MTNKDLLHSIGNYIQYFVITCKEKRIWKKYIYITESFCCIPKTNIINQLYFNFKKSLIHIRHLLNTTIIFRICLWRSPPCTHVLLLGSQSFTGCLPSFSDTEQKSPNARALPANDSASKTSPNIWLTKGTAHQKQLLLHKYVLNIQLVFIHHEQQLHHWLSMKCLVN